jgi:D-threonine aldolase
MNQYQIKNISELDTPALVVFPQIVERNIQQLVDAIDDVSRLRPHIKTHKCAEVIKLLQSADIQKFKCSTIAEAELLGMCLVEDILLAYQPNNAKLLRLIRLIKQYPKTHYSCLVDSIEVAQMMVIVLEQHKLKLSVFIDLNVGMNRTGILPENAFDLFLALKKMPLLQVEGLHAYDGHIHEVDMLERTLTCQKAFEPVWKLLQNIESQGFTNLKVIAGGSPTFPIHAQNKRVECSPGTFVFWDKGYQDSMPEQPFEIAVLVISRVISLPEPHKICLDLGHKSLASENVLNRRVYFPDVPNAKFIGHSEEHLVLDVGENHPYKIGDVFYGVPIHICPTVALHERMYVVENKRLTGEEWKIVARDKKISI